MGCDGEGVMEKLIDEDRLALFACWSNTNRIPVISSKQSAPAEWPAAWAPTWDEVGKLAREIQRHRAQEDANREARRIADEVSSLALGGPSVAEVRVGHKVRGVPWFSRSNDIDLRPYRAALARLNEKAVPEGATGSGLSFTALRGTPPPGAAPISAEERALLKWASEYCRVSRGGRDSSFEHRAMLNAYLASLPKKPSIEDEIAALIPHADFDPPDRGYRHTADSILALLRSRGWKEPA